MRVRRFDAFVVMILRFDDFESKFFVELYGTLIVYLDVPVEEKANCKTLHRHNTHLLTGICYRNCRPFPQSWGCDWPSPNRCPTVDMDTGNPTSLCTIFFDSPMCLSDNTLHRRRYLQKKCRWQKSLRLDAIQLQTIVVRQFCQFASIQHINVEFIVVGDGKHYRVQFLQLFDIVWCHVAQFYTGPKTETRTF